MISPVYFRHKIAITLTLFSTFLSLLFCVLVLVGIEKSDDNVREVLLASHAEGFTQYYAETNKLWARNQLNGIEVLIEGRDLIPEMIAQLPMGYFEDGDINLSVYTMKMKLPESQQDKRIYLVHSGPGKDWIEQYEPIIYFLLGIVTLLVIVVGIVLGIILSKKLSEPLQLLTQRVKSTNPNAPAFSALKRDDEFGEISEAFANTISRINEVLEREKQFSRYASHELRTPVAIINSSINLWEACEEESSKENAEKIKQRAMERISAATRQMEDVIQTFLILGKEGIDWPEGKPTQLSTLLDYLVEKYQYLQGPQQIQIEKTYLDTSRQVTNDTAVMLVLSNVLRNSFEYCASQIQIKLNSTSLCITNDIDALRVENADHFGFGIKIIEELSKMLNWSFRYENSGTGKFTIWFEFAEDSVRPYLEKILE